MTLEVWQLYVIGAVAAVLSQGIKLISAKAGYTPSKLVMTIVVFLVSGVLAYIFVGPKIPAPSDPNFVPQLVELVTALLGAAMAVYNILLDKVLEKVNLTVARFKAVG